MALRWVFAVVAHVALAVAASPAAAWSPSELFKPCRGDCATTIYWGTYVQDSLGDLFISPEAPGALNYHNDHLVATALSRDAAQFFHGHLHLEPEVGIAQRYGQQDETEVWAALFFRYRGFPWDDVIVTSVAASTGLNYASDVSEVEQDRANDGQGSQLMHFFSPEVTFALPSHPGTELVFRMHHRSGVFGLVSDAWGGAQYATVGLRIRF